MRQYRAYVAKWVTLIALLEADRLPIRLSLSKAETGEVYPKPVGLSLLPPSRTSVLARGQDERGLFLLTQHAVPD